MEKAVSDPQHVPTASADRVYVPLAGIYGEHALRYDETLDRELMRRRGRIRLG